VSEIITKSTALNGTCTGPYLASLHPRTHFFKIYFNITHASLPVGLFTLEFQTKIMCAFSSLPCVSHVRHILDFIFFHWLYSPRGPDIFFSFMIILQTVGLLGRVISSSQGLYLHTGQHKHRINTYTKLPCLVWDSKPRSQLLSERRQFMP
jgi:hypothetical protein